jgi:hypothetical protein
MEVSGQRLYPAALHPGKSHLYLLDRGLVGHRRESNASRPAQSLKLVDIFMLIIFSMMHI